MNFKGERQKIKSQKNYPPSKIISKLNILFDVFNEKLHEKTVFLKLFLLIKKHSF